MNLMLLSLGQMISLTSHWLRENEAVFREIPEISALHGKVYDVHKYAVEISESCRVVRREAELTLALQETDSQHDQAVRALWHALNGAIAQKLICNPPEREDAEALEQVRDQLLPEGLGYVLKPYLEEAGIAVQALQQLTPEMIELLSEVDCFGTDAMSLTRRWAELGVQLADLIQQRSQASSVNVESIKRREAKTRWTKVVSMVLQLLELSESDVEQVAKLRGPVVAALHIEEQRHRAAS